MNNSLVPFCPALPKLLAQGGLNTVSRTTLAPTALELLKNNQSIVISGKSHRDWERNRQIGKTSAVNERLIPRLMRRGLTVSYFNIQSTVYHYKRSEKSQFDYSLLSDVVGALTYTDVMVLDEIQLAMMSPNEVKFRHGHRLPYKGPILKLWRKVEGNLARGGKVVFISCCHPLDYIFDDCLLNSTMALYFSSPVLELKLPE